LLFIPQFVLGQTSQTDSYSDDNILKFADHLFKEKDFLRAAGEYQRYLFALKSPKDSIYYKIGSCFQSAQHYDRSITYFNRVIKDFNLSLLKDQSIYQIAKNYFLQKSYQKSISFSKSNFDKIESGTQKLYLSHLVGLSYLYQKQWQQAHQYLTSPDIQEDILSQKLIEFSRKGLNLKKKNGFIAGMLSAVIPGAGKVYAKRTMDGLVSFLTVGLTAWQAYDGFREKGVESVKGWIYTTLGVFFYLGNIYGSVIAVNIYNKQLEDKQVNEIGLAIRVFLH